MDRLISRNSKIKLITTSIMATSHSRVTTTMAKEVEALAALSTLNEQRQQYPSSNISSSMRPVAPITMVIIRMGHLWAAA